MAASSSLCETFEGPLIEPSKFTITLDKYSWKVNLDHLAAKSGFFTAIKSHQNFQEFKDQAVTLHEDKPEIFAAALQFMYYGAYELSTRAKVPYIVKEVVSQRVKATKKFGVSVGIILEGGLRESAKSMTPQQLEAYKRASPNSLRNKEVALHLLAQKYCIETLTQETLKSLKKWSPSNPEDIVEVFEPYLASLDVGDGGLKECLAGKIVARYEEVRNQATKVTKKIHGWLDEDQSLLLLVSDARGKGKKRKRGLPEEIPKDSRPTSRNRSFLGHSDSWI